MNSNHIKTRQVKVSSIVEVEDWSYRAEGEVEGSLESLKESIKKNGLLQPIIINEDNELIAGSRRLAACKALGMPTISAHIRTHAGGSKADMEEELICIDENLEREDLSERALSEALVRRKEIYQALWPQTKRGHAGAAAANNKRAGATSKPTPKKRESFAANTAKKLGTTSRSVDRLLARGKLAEPVKKAYFEEKKITAEQADMLTQLSKTAQTDILPKIVKTKSIAASRTLINNTVNENPKAIKHMVVLPNGDEISVMPWLRKTLKKMEELTVMFDGSAKSRPLANCPDEDLKQDVTDAIEDLKDSVSDWLYAAMDKRPVGRPKKPTRRREYATAVNS